jgi:2-iminobutanoate/2-iminopropanoate deaminase
VSKEIVSTDRAPGAIGPYSQAVKANGFVFCSGQIPINPESGAVEGETVAEQTELVLTNVRNLLEGAGTHLQNVVKTTVFLADMSYFKEMNEVYSNFFTELPPARSTVAVKELPLSVKVEIEVIALDV